MPSALTTGKFSFFIAKDKIISQGFKKLFGPQTLDEDVFRLTGEFSVSLELIVAANAPLKAPCNCGIRVVSDPNSGLSYLALRLYPTSVLRDLKQAGLLSEIPTFALIRKEDVTFRGLEEDSEYEGFLTDYLQQPPHNALTGSELPGELALKIRSGKIDLFFSSGSVFGKTKSSSLSISLLTTPQIRGLIETMDTPDMAAVEFWPELERRNYLDPITFWNSLVRGQEEFHVDVFATDTDFNDAKYWFASADRTPQRIIIELRDEHNIPILENDSRAPWIKVKSVPELFSTVTGNKTELLVSESQGGFMIIPAEATAAELISIRSSSVAVISPLDEQFVFWNSNIGRSYIDKSDLIPLEAPSHVLIFALRPADWFHSQMAIPSDELREENSNAAAELKRYSTGNKVRLFLDGVDYFRALIPRLESIDTASDEHFFHFCSWSLDASFDLLPAPYSTNPRSLAKLLATKLDKVRALIWYNFLPGFSSMAAVNIINGFEYGNPNDVTITLINTECKAILDTRQNLFLKSANHMKIAVVNSGSPAELIGFCGGMDIWPDRVTNGQHDESNNAEWFGLVPHGLHDTMLEIKGEAGYELDHVLYKRWIDATINRIPDRTPNKKSFGYTSYPGLNDEGTVITQVALTIDGRPDPKYKFATEGDFTLFSTLVQAIRNAKQYIYIEDQYFRDPSIISELRNALARNVLVIVLLPNVMWNPERYFEELEVKHLLGVVPIIGEKEEGYDSPRTRTEELRRNYPDLFNVFCAVVPPNDIYIHSKLWIIDDIFLSCGSANLDRKGMGSLPTEPTSCECNIFSMDAVVNTQGARKLAQDARIRLWSEHLFQESISSEEDASNSLFYELLLDPIGAYRNLWANLGGNERIRRLT